MGTMASPDSVFLLLPHSVSYSSIPRDFTPACFFRACICIHTYILQLLSCGGADEEGTCMNGVDANQGISRIILQ